MGPLRVDGHYTVARALQKRNLMTQGNAASLAFAGTANSAWRRRLLVGLLVVGGCVALGYWLALALGESARSELRQLRQQHAALEQQLADLQARLAIAERGTDVTGAANKQLRDELLQMELALDASRSDLEFYRRLLSAGLEKGLGVHELRVRPTASPRVFHYNLTLALNSRQPGPAKGQVRLAVHGISGDQPQTLRLADLGDGLADALRYEFRYFQQLSGDLILPQDFFPERLTVTVVPQSRGDSVTREFAWYELFDIDQSEEEITP